MDPDPSRDIGTTLPAFVEKRCGGRPRTCPWNVFTDPFVVKVLSLRRAFERGALDVRTLPAVLDQGIKIYDSALRRLEAWDDAQERKAREEKRRLAEAKAAGAQPQPHAVTVRSVRGR